jgi:hypothetical protein
LAHLAWKVEQESQARVRLGRLITELIARLSIIDIEVKQRLNQLEARIAILEAMQHARVTAETENQ